AIAAAADPNPADVDVPGPLDELIQRRHEVHVVLAAPIADDRAPEELPVAVGSPRVHVEDDVAHAREHLELVEEGPAVLAMRTAVDLHDSGIEAARLEVLRLEHPP